MCSDGGPLPLVLTLCCAACTLVARRRKSNTNPSLVVHQYTQGKLPSLSVISSQQYFPNLLVHMYKYKCILILCISFIIKSNLYY